MKISIITVCFNSAGSIVDTLDSVAAQTHPSIEHIVIDGGSTDGTVEMVRARGDRVSHFISEPDRGIYDAMNKGLRLATGDYVGFLNSDDVFFDSSSAKAIARAASASLPDAVFGDLVYVSQNQVDRVIRRWRTGAFYRSRLQFGWMPPHPTFYVRRALFSEIGGFDADLRIAADYDFMLRCLMRARATATYIPQTLVRMRLGGASNLNFGATSAKRREDLLVIRRYRLGRSTRGWLTLASKNLRKIPQFL